MPDDVFSIVNQGDTPVDILLNSSVQGGDQAGNSLRIAPHSSVQSTLRFVDNESLNKLKKDGKISWSVVPTVPEVTRLVIKNKTARRIAVARRLELASPEDDQAQPQPDVVDDTTLGDEGDDLANDRRHPNDFFVISALGSREMEESLYSRYEFEKWVQLDLIAVERKSLDSEPLVDWPGLAYGCSWVLLVLFLLVTVPLASLAQTIVDWPDVAIGAAVLAVAVFMIWVYRKIKKNKNGENQELSNQAPIWRRLWEFFVQLAKISLVAIIGVGLPAFTIYLYGGGSELLRQTPLTELALLGRALQLIFIATASTLPALMYFLFGRLRIENLRERFRREAMMLDPDITNDSEAAKYDSLFDSVYGYGTSAFEFLPVLISTVLITLGWTLTLLPIGLTTELQRGDLLSLFAPQTEAIVFGFLGAYFFSINMIYRRYVRADLTTKTYSYISVRIIITTILVWVISAVPLYVGADSSILNTGILALAFVIGVVPESGIVRIQDYVRQVRTSRAEKSDEKDPSLRENHPLTKLEGVTVYDRARLLEEGIDNIENLAHHDLMELIVSTRIPIQRLVDLFDQAILYIHLGLDANEVKEDRQILKRYGVRNATDLLRVHSAKALDDLKLPPIDEGNYGGKAAPDRLPAIIESLKDDEWMGYLCNWRNATMKVGNLNTIDDFYKFGSQHPCDPFGVEAKSPS